jgi:hypothetical protein
MPEKKIVLKKNQKLVPLRGAFKFGKTKSERITNLAINIVSNNNGKSDKSNLRSGVNYARKHFCKQEMSNISNDDFVKIYIRYERSLETLTRLDAIAKAIAASLKC